MEKAPELQSRPDLIKEVGFDFNWDERKVWALDVPTGEIDISELTWHLDTPFLWHGEGVYNLTPRTVMDDPVIYKHEYDRMERADTSYPIDIMDNKGRWVILDGLHRLMKLYKEGRAIIKVRMIPRELIHQIEE